MAPPKIILYTNHLCPWAHRAHIALKELGLEYEEVIIDLDTPREPWYLEVNPRGLVPTISYNGTIIPESAIVAQLLADAHPSHLVPPSNTPEGAIQRAHISFFVDTFFSKVWSQAFAAQKAANEEDRAAATEGLVTAIEKNDLEGLLYPAGSGSGPFFRGAEKLTQVEVLTGSFLLRLLSLYKPQYGLLSENLPTLLETRAPKFLKWAQAVVKEESVNYIWNEETVGTRTAKKWKAAAKQ
ncbi:glutathione S-transferase family protein [Aspergillus stella-maris]|uniref:glutathione S-transferase family protein n=1 Tax=Aspergillus stella-maris TaxID=1810926 RepID=UPI003CCE4454